MAKDKKPKKAKTQVNVNYGDLTDMIRDEIYGAAIASGDVDFVTIGGKHVICIASENVGAVADRIAKRAFVGH